MTVESRIRHSRSGSCNTPNTFAQTLERDQRSNRRHAEFQRPNRSGRSGHGHTGRVHLNVLRWIAAKMQLKSQNEINISKNNSDYFNSDFVNRTAIRPARIAGPLSNFVTIRIGRAE